MKNLIMLTVTMLFASPFLLADDHDHGNDHIKPSHGGEILEVGDHVAHIEFVHDEKHGKVVLHVLDKEGKSLGIGDAPRLNLTYEDGKKEKKMQIVAKAINLKDGKSHEFEAEDKLFNSEDFEGKISIKIKGKTYRVELHHHDEHEGHDHDDHKGHNH